MQATPRLDFLESVCIFQTLFMNNEHACLHENVGRKELVKKNATDSRNFLVTQIIQQEQNMSLDYDQKLKIILIGDTAVGKSCILRRFTETNLMVV